MFYTWDKFDFTYIYNLVSLLHYRSINDDGDDEGKCDEYAAYDSHRRMDQLGFLRLSYQ